MPSERSALCLQVDADELAITEGNKHRQQLCLPYWALPFEDFLYLSSARWMITLQRQSSRWLSSPKRTYVRNHPELGLNPNGVTADTPVPFSVRQLWLTLHEMHFATHTVQSNAQTDATRAYATDKSRVPLIGDAESVSPPTFEPTVPSKIFLSGAAINVRRQTNSLGARLRDPRYNFLFRPGKWDVDDSTGEVSSDLGDFLETWLGAKESVVIADLSGVPNQVLQRIVSVLLRLLYEKH